jgi:molybdopterin synthase sulfur carrier subunit
MATVWVPGQLQQLTGGKDAVEAAGATVKELVADLDRRYPGFRDALVQDGVLVRPGISVVVDGQIVKKGLLQPVNPDSEVFFVPAIGGG